MLLSLPSLNEQSELQIFLSLFTARLLRSPVCHVHCRVRRILQRPAGGHPDHWILQVGELSFTVFVTDAVKQHLIP